MHNKVRDRPFAPPHARPLPSGASSFSQSLKFIKNPLEGLDEQVYEKGHTKHKTFSVEMHVLTDPEPIHQVLAKVSCFRKSEINQRIFGGYTEEGIIVAHDEKWKRQRKTLAPIFQHRNIVNLVGTFADTAVRCARELTPGTHDLQDMMSNISFEILADSILGDPQIDREKIRAAAMVMVEATSKLRLDDFLPLPKWVPRFLSPKAYKARRVLRASATKSIRETEINTENTRTNLLQLLKAASLKKDVNQLSELEKRDNVIGFYIAGHETTALSLTWAAYLIAQSPGTQERLLEEVGRVLNDGPITFERLEEMVFLKAVIYETYAYSLRSL